MACQEAPLPLDALNASNEYLAHAMKPIIDGPITVKAGEALDLRVAPTCRKCYCVTNYKIGGDGSDAIFSPWVQEFVDE